MRQPLHPLLAHFPIAFLLATSACDLWQLREVAHVALAAGLVTGLAALLAGVAEILLRPLSSEAFRWLIAHAAPMQLALVLYLVSYFLRGDDAPTGAALVTSYLGAGLLLLGMVCGGVLVFRYRIGTQGGSPRNS